MYPMQGQLALTREKEGVKWKIKSNTSKLAKDKLNRINSILFVYTKLTLNWV
jgi:hypothetical protein